VQVEYESLDVLVDAEESLGKIPFLLHEDAGTNQVWRGVSNYGDIEKGVSRSGGTSCRIDKMHFHRFSSTPLENNAVIGSGDPKDEAHLLLVQQFFPHQFAMQFIAAHLASDRPNSRPNI